VKWGWTYVQSQQTSWRGNVVARVSKGWGRPRGSNMGYRIQFLRDDRKMGDVGSEKPLPETLEDAIDLMPLFYSDHALIVDEAGRSVEMLMKSA